MSAGEPVWLSEQQMAAWLPLVRLLSTLPSALDTTLREQAGLTHVYYQVLHLLSASPDDALRMSELARAAGTSVSRLSHAVASMEAKGWVERRPAPGDRRGQVARLTPDGRRLLEQAAPLHVADVRRRVFDRLTDEETAQLAALARKLVDCPP